MIELWAFLGAASLFVMACVQVASQWTTAKHMELTQTVADGWKAQTERGQRASEWERTHSDSHKDLSRYLHQHGQAPPPSKDLLA